MNDSNGRLEEAAVTAGDRCGTGSESQAASSSTPSIPAERGLALLPPATQTTRTSGRGGGVLNIYCHGRPSPVRYLGGGWGLCVRCNDRIRVVK